jgi:hypothetical protein
MKNPETVPDRLFFHSGRFWNRPLLHPLPYPFLMATLVLSLSACTPKQAEVRPNPPPNPFDYSRSDLEGLVEFSNRFGTLPGSARIAVCREMEVFEKEGKKNGHGLTLHQAAAQIFFANCSPSPVLEEKLKSLLENPETPPDQKQFASLAQQLIARQESQSNALIQAQRKARAKSINGGIHRKPDSTDRETPSGEDASKPSLPVPISDDVARKKLEALRNLEKSMDRGLRP